jgi:uncharacterized protein (TIGR03435 family)
MTKRTATLAIVRILLMTATAGAQTAAVEFDVASVKPVPLPVPPHVVSLLINHGTLRVEAAELRQVVGLAYKIQRIRVLGGPAWMDADLFDIVAKTDKADAGPDEIRPMLQTLLAQRFNLSAHRETKVLPECSLVPGKRGPKLNESKEDAKPDLTFGARPRGEHQVAFRKTAVRVLVNLLANTLGSPVIDKTGLEGLYDFTLEWTDAGDPSLFSALEEQLGLKLEARKSPVEVLVIDHAEKPAGN